MNFLKKFLGQESLNKRVNRLWEQALKLGWTEPEQKKAVSLYTELLNLVDENSTEFNVCAIFRNRAISYRCLKNYDMALSDLNQELEISRRRRDRLREMECQKVFEETRVMKQRDEIQVSGGQKAKKFRDLEKLSHKLWRDGPEARLSFENLFNNSSNDDPDIRVEASRLLAESNAACERLISVYQENVHFDSRRASLAGRVLGRRIVSGLDNMVRAETVQTLYGLDGVAFIPCSCAYCSYLNKGIATPRHGPSVPYYAQTDDEGTHAIPVLCDKCGREFFVVWDCNPGIQFPFPGIGIAFNLENLSDAWPTSAWLTFMKNLNPKRLGKCILIQGRTAATLKRQANEGFIGVYGPQLEPDYVRETFERLDEVGLAPLRRRFIEKLALDTQPWSISKQINESGCLITRKWTRSDHELCKATDWGYYPQEIPPEMRPVLLAELEQLGTLCSN